MTHADGWMRCSEQLPPKDRIEHGATYSKMYQIFYAGCQAVGEYRWPLNPKNREGWVFSRAQEKANARITHWRPLFPNPIDDW
jgi:hypothetical protein